MESGGWSGGGLRLSGLEFWNKLQALSNVQQTSLGFGKLHVEVNKEGILMPTFNRVPTSVVTHGK